MYISFSLWLYITDAVVIISNYQTSGLFSFYLLYLLYIQKIAQGTPTNFSMDGQMDGSTYRVPRTSLHQEIPLHGGEPEPEPIPSADSQHVASCSFEGWVHVVAHMSGHQPTINRTMPWKSAGYYHETFGYICEGWLGVEDFGHGWRLAAGMTTISYHVTIMFTEVGCIHGKLKHQWSMEPTLGK